MARQVSQSEYSSKPTANQIANNIRPSVEIGFSPQQGAKELIIKAIDAAQRQIQVMAYIYSSRDITQALLRARHRGVSVQMLLDYKGNVLNVKTEGERLLAQLSAAGADIKTTDGFAIMHNKVMIIDSTHLQTGSFNYTHAADTRNAENVIVLWHQPDIASTYQRQWQAIWRTASPYTPTPPQ